MFYLLIRRILRSTSATTRRFLNRSATRIADIDSLVETALARFGGLPGIPGSELGKDIAACKLPGRRSRKKRRGNDS